MLKLLVRGLYLAGIIVSCLAFFFYVRFQVAKGQWDRTPAIITSLSTLPDSASQSITLQYTINNETSRETITTDQLTLRDLHVGDTLMILVNPEDSGDKSLLESEAYMNRLAMKTAAWGLVIFAIGFAVSRVANQG